MPRPTPGWQPPNSEKTQAGTELTAQLSGWQRFRYWMKNYWYYYKVPTFVILCIVLLATWIIVSTVTKPKPDYSIAILTEQGLETDDYMQLQRFLEQYAEDRNGDGKVTVALQNLAFGTGSAEKLQAASAQMSAMLMLPDTVLFLTDDFAYETLDNPYTAYEEDEMPQDTGESTFGDVSSLITQAGKGATRYYIAESDLKERIGLTGYPQNFSISVRNKEGITNERFLENYDAAKAFIERVLNNTPVQ